MPPAQPEPQGTEGPPASGTYEAGCHCGYIRFAVTLTPPLPEQKVKNCDCSACRRFGYLLVYPKKEKVEWHGKSRERCGVYRFNTKEKDHLFCPRCGASLMIDMRDFYADRGLFLYGVNVRAINGVDLDALNYEKTNGSKAVEPAGDLSGMWYKEEGGEDGGEKPRGEKPRGEKPKGEKPKAE